MYKKSENLNELTTLAGCHCERQNKLLLCVVAFIGVSESSTATVWRREHHYSKYWQQHVYSIVDNMAIMAHFNDNHIVDHYVVCLLAFCSNS